MIFFGLSNAYFSLSSVYFTDVMLTTFLLFKFKEHLKVFVNYVISKHKNIPFTFQAEVLNSFLFLTVKTTRKIKRFVTSIFCKATFNGVFTNYGLVHTLFGQTVRP